MRTPRILLLLSILFVSVWSRAQNINLAFGDSSQITNLPTQVYYNDQASYFVWVDNLSANTYQGLITLYTTVDTGMGADTVQIDTFGVVIPGYSSLPLVMNEVYTAANYRIGGNIVVIWPSAMNANWTNGSTVPDTVFVLGYNSVSDNSGGGISVYPVPFNTTLHIDIKNPHETPRRLILRDISGRLIFDIPFAEVAEFPEHLASGVYIMELQYSSSPSDYIRVVKNRK